MVKKSICLILVLAIMVPLGGCKKANEVLSAGVSREILDDDKVSMDRRPNEHSNSDIEGNGIIYVGNRLSFPEQNVTFEQAARLGEKVVMLGTSGENQVLYKMDPDGSNVEKLEYSEEERICYICESIDSTVRVLGLNEDGEYTVLSQTEDKEWTKLVLPMLKEYEESIITQITKVENGYIVFTATDILALDAEGILAYNIGKYYRHGICVQQEDGKSIIMAQVIESPGDKSPITRTIVLDSNFSPVARYDSNKQFTAFYADNKSNSTTVLAEFGNVLYRFDYINDTRETLIDMFSSSMNVYSLIYVKEGLLFGLDAHGPSLWQPSNGTSAKQLTLAAYNLDFTLSKLVTEYNNSGANFKINVIDYAKYDEAGHEGQGLDMLRADIVAGFKPDIYDLSQLPAELYAEKGLFEDLKPYFSGDAPVIYSDFVQSAVEVLEYEDGLYYIAPGFEAVTLCGDSSFVGDNGSWRPKDFFNAVDGMAAENVFGPEVTKDIFLYYLLAFLEDEYVDKEKLACDFESQSFQDFLSFAAGLPDDVDYENLDSQPIARAYVGEQPILIRQIGSSAIVFLSFTDTIFGGQAEYVGFPAESSSGVALLPHALVSMSASSPNKEGVMDFIYFILSPEAQTADMYCPIIQSLLDERMELWEEKYLEQPPILNTYFEDSYIAIEGTTDIGTAKARLKAIIENMDCMMSCDEALLNIIIRESQPFFVGDISVKQASASIQSRAQIYISEQYG